MRNLTRVGRFWERLFGVLLLCAASTAWGAAGEITFVSGEAWIERGEKTLSISTGDEVEEGDAIITRATGRVRVRMESGDQFALNPNTRFRVDEFRPPEARDADAPATQKGRGFYSLFRGSLQGISAALGPRTLGNFRLNTPVATMGIRGTAYELYLAQDISGVQSGFYVKVTEGSVTLQNAAGTLVVEAGQTAFVANSATMPALIDSLPAELAGTTPVTTGTSAGAAAAGTADGDTVGTTLGILGVIVGAAILLSDGGGGGGSSTTTTQAPPP